MQNVLVVEGVSKRFRTTRWRPTLKESLLQRITGGGQASDEEVWALRDVSFEVARGDAFGIVGHNGAGKSTLLRLLCGVGRPTSGRVRRQGHVHGLLELGSGFHGDLTGRENLRTGGILSGFTEREVRSREDDIIAFAELEETIDQPVRTYSSGMYLRLAFAVATHFDPDVLVVDEVLAVGDARFQAKCLERLRAFRTGGGTLVITSHVAEHLKALCDEVLVLEDGRVVMSGDPEEAMQCYEDVLTRRTERRAAALGADPRQLVGDHGSRHGTGEALIKAVRLLDAAGRPLEQLRSGDELAVEIEFERAPAIGDVALTLAIHREGAKAFELSLESVTAAIGALDDRRSVLRCRLPSVPLLPGPYWVNVGLYPSDWSVVYDYHWQMHGLVVTAVAASPFDRGGVVDIAPECTLVRRE
jgi:lipopolysaccharide transport system ATP-binding protein